MTKQNIINNQRLLKYNSADSLSDILYDILAILICLISLQLCYLESLVNQDSFHWGFAYSSAIDIKRGLIPYRDVLIPYGIMTTCIQSFFLNIFGERLISIGLATGIFYSVSLFLSYKIFSKILPKYAAFVSLFIIFILHRHIIYPWSNYYSYTFQLAGIFLFIKDDKSLKNMFICGLFLALSILCRYVSIFAVLTPILIFSIFDYFKSKYSKIFLIKKYLLIALGLLVPLLIFLTFVLFRGILRDFLIQNEVIVNAWGFSKTSRNPFLIVERLYLNLIDFRALDAPRQISFIFTVIFSLNLAALIYLIVSSIFNKFNWGRHKDVVILLCLTSLSGWLNVLHNYDIFRLINGSSIGIGVIIYFFIRWLRQSNKWIKFFTLVSIFVVGVILGESLIPKYIDFDKRFKGKVMVGRSEIKLFEGKILSKGYYDYYFNIYSKIRDLDCSYSVINFSNDSVTALINNLPRVQLSAYYIPELTDKYIKEQEKIEQFINQRKAIIISSYALKIEGYKIIFDEPEPVDRPWKGSGRLRIYVPDKMNNVSPNFNKFSDIKRLFLVK